MKRIPVPRYLFEHPCNLAQSPDQDRTNDSIKVRYNGSSVMRQDGFGHCPLCALYLI
jgi:hypothetical protein